MNIFITSTNPNIAATHLDDTRLNKMILETAQILSTNNHLLNLSYKPYKLTHQNHPCTVWARQSVQNALWLTDYLHALCTEYKHRFNKEHKTSQHVSSFYQALLQADPAMFPKTELTPFVNCAIDAHKPLDTVLAYQTTMCFKWHFDSIHKYIKLKWTNRAQPDFYTAFNPIDHTSHYKAYEVDRIFSKEKERAIAARKKAKNQL